MLGPLDDLDRLDPVEAWVDAHERLCALLLDLTPVQTSSTVPATPDWTVRDLTAHMVGVGADRLSGDEDPDHAEWWTAGHVRERAGRDIVSLVTEWRDIAPQLTEHMRRHGARPLADLTIHEHDLRGAVGRPGAQDAPALAWVTASMLRRAREALDAAPGRPTLALRSPSGTWCSRPDLGAADCDVEVRASDFDLARALTTRRTAAELQAYTERGDIDDVVAAFSLLGPLPEEQLPC